MFTIILYVALGILAGISSGFFGIGGAVIIIPALVLLGGFTQHQAQGTTLALMIPPIGLLAAMKYYHHGNINVKAALFICAGFVLGGLLGAKFAMPIPEHILKKAFACFLMIVSLKMLF